MEEKMENYDEYARKIQTYWRSFRDRRLFRVLMNTVRSAEQCLTSAVLRQLSPKESELLKDPSLRCKLRFRFAGPQFPPSLVFKIFHTGGRRNYLSGKKVFTSSSQATKDTCRMMGNRVFMDVISLDETHRAIVEPQDVICMRDYMQFSSRLDELPACLGGRENGWRLLSLKALSRDVTRGSDVGRLPIKHLVRSQFTKEQPSHRDSLTSTRHSKRAQIFVARRRHVYSPTDAEKVLNEHTDSINSHDIMKQNETEKLDIKIVLPSVETEDGSGDDKNNSSESEWEEEAERLCKWSKHSISMLSKHLSSSKWRN